MITVHYLCINCERIKFQRKLKNNTAKEVLKKRYTHSLTVKTSDNGEKSN